MRKSTPNRIWKAALTRALCVGLLLVTACLPGLTAGDAAKSHTKYPRQIFLIRHAEKPPRSDLSVHLSSQGMERARALPALFKTSKSRPRPFATPEVIFATQDSQKSHRPAETVTPLARYLKLPIHQDFANRETSKAAQAILANPRHAGKTILVCWHHGTMPELARQLKATGYPDPWDSSVFDRVWQITYDARGTATFVDRPQRLLPGDAEK
jgi:hypothetical protein